MKILKIRCSPRPQSFSNQLADQIFDALSKVNDAYTVDELDAYQIPHIDMEYAERLMSRNNLPASSDSLELSTALIQQLREADAIVISTPMHNYTVPSALKAWIDHVVRIGDTFLPTPEGKVGSLVDRPVYIAIASGGQFQGEHAKQPDFLTEYLRVVFNTMGITSLHYFIIEGTVLGEQHLQSEFEKVQTQLQLHFT